MTALRISRQKNDFPCERAIQLRGEVVAAMKLRLARPIPRNCDSTQSGDGSARRRSAERTRILAISDYDALRMSREQVLRLEGFQVESVSSLQLFEDAWVNSFDVAVVCQSVAPSRAARIANRLRQSNPNIALLRINPGQGNAEAPSLFDFELEGLAGPRGLLNAIESIGRGMGNGGPARLVVSR